MRLIASLLAFWGLALPARVLAQEPTSAPYFGVSAGLEAVPAGYADICGPLSDQSPAGGLGGELRAGMPLRPKISLETQLTVQAIPEMTCTAIPLIHPNGVHTDRFRDSEESSRLYGSDVRLRFEPYSSWVLMAGAGWMWNQRDPYWVGSVGWRWGTRLRAVLDAEITGYRITTRALTREWQDFEVAEVLSDRREHLWQTGLGLRAGIEVSFR